MGKAEKYGFSPGQGKHHEDIIYSIALLYNIIYQDISDYLEPFGMTVGKFNLLMAVKHHGGEVGLKQVDISRHLILTPSNMTKLIDKLEEDRLVERLALDGDRRVNIVRVTVKGSELLEKIWPGYIALLQQSVAPLDTSRQKQLAGLLTAWFERIR